MRIGTEEFDSVQDFIEVYLKNNRLAELVDQDDDRVEFRLADGSADVYAISE